MLRSALIRRSRIGAYAALVSIAASALGAAAQADPPGPAYWLYERAPTTMFERGQFFAGFTLNAGVQQLPRFNGTQSIHNTGAAGSPLLAATSFTPEALGVQPGGEIGYVFRDGTFPAWLGSRVRTALYGSYMHAETKRSQSIRATGTLPVATYFGADGTFLDLSNVVAGSVDYAETLKIEREGFQLGLKLESDVALGPNLSLTPGVAVFGGRMSESFFHTSALGGVPGFDSSPTALSERLRTTEIGGHLGARLTWQFLPGFALHAGATAGPVWMQTRMTAADCLNPGTLVAAGTPCGPSGTFLLTTSAADRRSTVGFRGTASLGLAVDARIAVISLGGFMRYDSHIPGIRNPQLTSALAFAPLAPAHIRFDDGFAYGGFLVVRMPLPH